MILLVVDGSEPLEAEDWDIARLAERRPVVVVTNKRDLPLAADLEGFLPSAPRVRVSALTGEGLDELKEMILDQALGGEILPSDGILVTSVRHKEALDCAVEHVRAAKATLREGLPADFVTIDLRAALDSLGEITGQTVAPDMLDSIFSKFCIGK
jgi:tRNA modification GTPase